MKQVQKNFYFLQKDSKQTCNKQIALVSKPKKEKHENLLPDVNPSSMSCLPGNHVFFYTKCIQIF